MKTKTVFSFLLFVCFSVTVFAQAPNWQWAKTSSEPSASYGTSVGVDAAGNSYVAGYFRDSTITFGSTTLTYNGSNLLINLYLLKYDAWGNMLWAKNAGGSTSSISLAQAVAVDDSGNVFITGTFGDSVIFGSTLLINSGSPASPMFLAKYNSSGNVVWAKSMGGGGGDDAYSVAVDASGNSYVTGIFHSGPTATFGNIVLTNTTAGLAADMFVVKYDPSGNVLWAKGYGGNFWIKGVCVTIDASGNPYVAGSFCATSVTFGSYTLTCSGAGNTFLVKYDSLGNVLWAKSAGPATFYSGANSVSTDASGNSYVTGFFGDTTISFGSVTLTNSGPNYAYDMFLVKYGPLGNVIWARNALGSGYDDVGNSVFADKNGNSYVTGYFNSPSITFGSFTLTNNSTSLNSGDLFLTKYNSSGNVLWVKSAGGIYGDEANSVAVDTAGNCYIAGEFSSPTISFSPTTLFGNNNFSEMFIAKTSFFPLGINSPETSGENISIYPNPSSGIFSLEMNGSNFSSQNLKTEIEIFDVLGNIVFKSAVQNSKTEIDLSENAKGIYFYRIFNAEETVGSGKIIVQ